MDAWRLDDGRRREGKKKTLVLSPLLSTTCNRLDARSTAIDKRTIFRCAPIASHRRPAAFCLFAQRNASAGGRRCRRLSGSGGGSGGATAARGKEGCISDGEKVRRAARAHFRSRPSARSFLPLSAPRNQNGTCERALLDYKNMRARALARERSHRPSMNGALQKCFLANFKRRRAAAEAQKSLTIFSASF